MFVHVYIYVCSNLKRKKNQQKGKRNIKEHVSPVESSKRDFKPGGFPLERERKKKHNKN